MAEVAVFEAEDDDAVAAIEATDAEDPETLPEAVQVAEVLPADTMVNAMAGLVNQEVADAVAVARG